MFEWTVQRGNFQCLMAVCERYRLELEGWKWNRGADFLFRCLIHVPDLEDHEEYILQASPASSKKSNLYSSRTASFA